SRLASWPVKLRLLNPNAPYLQNADLLVAADCTAFASGVFHKNYLQGRVPITFCPKLDQDINEYVEKLTDIFLKQKINSVTIVRMEVPCCAGTEKIVDAALNEAGLELTVRRDIIKASGEIKHSETSYV
ncbi:MAG: 4Fe-4S ferredoxin, partial [Verrucomicrobiota bacterium]